MEMEHELKVERLERELAEKGANLEKAATIGKSLLEANQELEQRNEELVADCTKQIEALEQEKYTLHMQLTNKEQMERHQTAEIETLQEAARQEAVRIREHLELEHSREMQKMQSACEGLRADLELARIQSEQLREQVKTLEKDLQEALTKANTTILDVSMSLEEKLSLLQEENISMTSEKMQLASRLKDKTHEVEQLKFSNHTLTVKTEELESRADEEHKQCVTYSRALQETRTQLEELQAELDLLKLETTDPNRKGNSLFAEVEDKRQAMEKKMIGLQLRYDAMQKQLSHKKQQVHSLKYQIAGLLQMDGGRVAASQVERLEQLLAGSRSTVQTLTQKLHQYQNHEHTFEPTSFRLESADEKQDLGGLKKFYQSKLDQTKKEKEKLEHELQAERMQRMSCEDRLLECQRNLYASERQTQQLRSSNVILNLKTDELRAKLTEHGIGVDKEVKGGYQEKIPIPEKYRKKAKETKEDTALSANTESQKTATADSPNAESSERLPTSAAASELESKKDADISSMIRPTPSVLNKAKKKTVSISDNLMVVDGNGSIKRCIAEEEEEKEGKEEGEKENVDSVKRIKEGEEGKESGSKNGNGTVKGKRGRRVFCNEQKLTSNGQNECNQQ